jgi:carboxylesterase type B
MVWIFGGGYVIGDAFEFGVYDGSHLASKYNMVIVAMNYRLSALGFFALNDLKTESGTAGNYALQDQRAALEWVQRNIANFGGDSSRVTIFGESAGAFSVMWQIVSPKSAGLFHGAIMESGDSDVSWFFQRFSDSIKFYDAYAEYLGCPNTTVNQLACLRELPFEKFIIPMSEIFQELIANEFNLPLPADVPIFGSPVFPLMPFGPVIDGSPDGLMGLPSDLVASGAFNHVPVLLGNNKNDGSIFEPSAAVMAPGFAWPATDASVKNAMTWFLTDPANVTESLELYPESEFQSASYSEDVRLAHVIRDVMFACSNRRISTSLAKAGLDVFLYVFAFNLGPLDALSHLGDFHASELPFVWQTFLPLISKIANGTKEMSDIISSRWANFAYCQTPNGCTGGPPNANVNTAFWPPFKLDDRQYYSLQLPSTTGRLQSENIFPDDEFPSDTKCDFWDQQLFLWHNLRTKPNVFSKLPFQF